MERKTSSRDASARHDRSNTLALKSYSTSRRLPGSAIPSCFDFLERLSFGSSSQYQFGLLDRKWKVKSRGRRVEANRSPQLGIPKIGSSIPALHDRSTVHTKLFLPL